MATQVNEVVLKGLHEITQKLTGAEPTDWVIVIQDLTGSPTIRIVSVPNLLAGMDLSSIDASLALKADKSNVLEKNNIYAYTPTADYHPVTKKFLEDLVIGLGTGDVLGPSSAGNQRLVVFNGTTGKIIADGGFAITEVARRTQQNQWQGSQWFSEPTLTESDPIIWDVQQDPCATVILTTDGQTVLNPVALDAGSTYMLKVQQDGSGGNDLYWGNKFKWPNGTKPVLTANPLAVDVFSFYSDGTYLYGIMAPNFA